MSTSSLKNYLAFICRNAPPSTQIKCVGMGHCCLALQYLRDSCGAGGQRLQPPVSSNFRRKDNPNHTEEGPRTVLGHNQKGTGTKKTAFEFRLRFRLRLQLFPTHEGLCSSALQLQFVKDWLEGISGWALTIFGLRLRLTMFFIHISRSIAATHLIFCAIVLPSPAPL